MLHGLSRRFLSVLVAVNNKLHGKLFVVPLCAEFKRQNTYHRFSIIMVASQKLYIAIGRSVLLYLYCSLIGLNKQLQYCLVLDCKVQELN